MPGTISFDGLATGINTTETVDKLIEVASRPKILKEAELARQENQLSTWQEINTKLLDLRTPAKSVWDLSTWNTLSANSSNESVLKATTSSSARSGAYTFTVENLAKNHQISSGTFASELDSVGTGDITITRGTESATITLDATNNTLTGLADAINAEKIGVTASVINDGSNYRLLLSSDDTGLANAISITRDSTVDVFYQRSPEDKNTTTYTELQAAADATILFGSGAGALAITSASNDVEDVVPGVTLNLVSASPGTEVTLSLTRDTSAVEEKLQAFVDAYNSVKEFISEQFAFDPKTNQGGILMGDRTLLVIQERLQSLLVNSVATGGKYNSLGAVGISVEDDGTLSFDSAEFQTAVTSDYASVQNVFRTSGSTDHSKVDFIYAGRRSVEPSSDGYSVVVTQAAGKATTTGTGDAALTINQGSNDTLTLALDGGTEVTVTLTAGTYTIDTLATEIQNQVNTAATGGSQVSVSSSSGTKLQFTSNIYGTKSQLQLIGGTALADLGFTTNTTASGQDVAGTINGEAATGSGQTLSGASGNSKTDGIILSISLSAQDLVDAGGSVTSTLTFGKGIGNRFDEYLQGLTTPLVGTVDTRETAIQNTIGSLEETIANWEERLEVKRTSLLQQFYKMESTVNQFNSQGNFLVNALSGLNSNWKWNS